MAIVSPYQGVADSKSLKESEEQRTSFTCNAFECSSFLLILGLSSLTVCCGLLCLSLPPFPCPRVRLKNSSAGDPTPPCEVLNFLSLLTPLVFFFGGGVTKIEGSLLNCLDNIDMDNCASF